MPALAALATTSDATAYGLTVTSAALLRASTRVRAYTGQRISTGSSTIRARGPVVRLPERPVTAVTSVTDSDGVVLTVDVDYELVGQDLTLPTSGEFTVVYSHGFATVPDGVLEVVCTIAARLGATDTSVASGVVQEQSGSVSQTFGWDAWKGLSSLTSEEKRVLDRTFPRLPRTISMRG